MGKQSAQTRTAFYLTLATLAIVALTSITVHTANYMSNDEFHFYSSQSSSLSSSSSSSSFADSSHLRYLEGDDGNNDDNDDNANAYSDQICDDIFTLTEAGSEERCQFAKSCNSNTGLQFNFIFCNTFDLSTTTWILILSPFLLLWLILLFRMLGSTAEDFFSPSLEMFSMKMGLPPRFAGVTLLALGNGAADVSATINAIVQNPAKGYQMSLGALTGAGMFVGTVVAGIVIVIADGVKCRGALVRDVLMFLTTLFVVFRDFEDGMIGTNEVRTFLWMYFGFVMIVLLADVYHRAVVLPRMRKIQQESVTAGTDDDEHNDGNGNGNGNRNGNGNGNDGGTGGENESDDNDDDGNRAVATNYVPPGEVSTHSKKDKRNVTFSASEDIGDVELANQNEQQSALYASTDSFSTHPDEDGDTSDENNNNSSQKAKKKKRPGFLRKKKKKGKISKVQKGVESIMMALSNYGPEEGNPNTKHSFKGWSEGLEVTSDSADKPVRFHGANGILSKASSDRNLDEYAEDDGDEGHLSGPQASYRMLLENVDNLCTVDGSTSTGMNITWGNSLSTSWHELKQHFIDYIDDIFTNEENNVFDKFFMVCELPFSILRKLSVPIPCEDFYCRGLLAVSFALAPLWFGAYCFIEKDWDLFHTGGSPIIEILTIISFTIGLFLAKFAPAEEKEMSLAVSVPIAFVGFIIAATWIDTIADFLVKLLTLLGVICRIPGSIMGLTVLAWGNSMGDLSANMTMAKKGLANMAITACFAGPVFNILIGLGGGFAKLNAYTGQDETEVQMTPSISVGFIFLACNCTLVLLSGLLWNRGQIPKEYGYLALTLYVSYIILSVWLQFHMDNDN